MVKPLPDERPRASVANLIGRFEQQNKKTPPISTAPVIPGRSSSVVSNITGDSTKEAVKEKREWPPKSTSSTSQVPPIINASPFTNKLSSFTSQPELETTTPPKPSSDVSSPEPVAVLDIPSVVEPAVTPQHEEQEGTKGPASPPSKVERISKSPPPPSSFRSPAKAPAKAASRTSNASSTPALRPQHTGTSTTSTTSTRKPAVPRMAPNTPSRPKTATSPRPKTPSRSKTPTSTPSVSRAKTPSNLFAPTAASLARSRNASAEAQTPSKKATLSSASADRLSKPTASSLSKAKATPSTATPSRGSPSARGTPTARGTARGAKPRSSVATSAKPGASKTAASQAPADPVAPETEEVTDLGDHTNGHISSPPPEDRDEPVDESHNEKDVAEPNYIVEAVQHEEVETDLGAVEDRSPSHSDHPADEGEGETTPSKEVSDPSTENHTEDGGKTVQNGIHEAGNAVGTDIEDMVKLLEFKPRPVSMVNIPDEVNEIPDED
ncbi:hypothetical protein VNI00_005216 [Paramarasmius palmivorus]|uniref:Uncharacterized protein n=1 Tax=Paramarasmius palmivorus TaxID=297713 RepID=A0AAW0DHU2_9AGAR